MSRRFMLDVNVAYPEVSKTAVLTPGQGQQLRVYAAHLLNRSGAAMDMALLIKRPNNYWKFGTLTALSAPEFTDATTAIQAGTTQNIFTLANNDGFLVQSPERFNLIGLTITQIQTGAPTYKFQYFNGVAYVDLPDVIQAPSFTGVGDTVLFFSSPIDWAPGTTAGVGGSPGLYSIQCFTPAASTQVVQANALWVGTNIHYQPQVANNGLLTVRYSEEYPRDLNALEGLLPFFQTASPKNIVTAQYFSHG